MKTFKQFLSEEEAQSIIELIRRDCGPFLAKVKSKGLLYRGIKKKPKPLIKTTEGVMYAVKTVRTDRRPLETDKTTHKKFNVWFTENFGYPARSETMFCVGEKGIEMTEQYGSLYVVFPIGDFQHIWSTEIRDLWEVADGASMYGEETQEEVNELLDDLSYTDKDFDKAVSSEHEIMVKCNSYYAISMVQGQPGSKTFRGATDEFLKKTLFS